MKYILSVDQSTSATKVALLSEDARLVRAEKMAHRQYYPAPGHVEHDAEEIYGNVRALIARVTEGIDSKDIAALAIANQRETTVLWDRKSGAPVAPAIVWQDIRGAQIAKELAGSAEGIRKRTGIALSAYYPACKAVAALRADAALARRAKDGEICVGTIDSFLIYRLTGRRVFATDLSNAGRTQLLNLFTLTWDDELLKLFGLQRSMLAEKILPCDALYGETARGVLPFQVPIRGVLGDSHASLFAHGCHAPGQVKTSYGTGSSIMMNVGDAPVFSNHGLSCSVGYGFRGVVNYVLEGNLTSSADTLIWLRDELQLISSLDEVEPLARSVPDAQGVCLVPAFSGLGAPYFDENARALLYGMNRGTTKAHVLHAALLSIAQQNEDVLEAMAADLGAPVTTLHADGGGSVNSLLMQMQADLSRCEVKCAAQKDLTLLGAGLMAGLSAELFDYRALFEIKDVAAHYAPLMDAADAQALRAAWKDAVARCR